MALKLYKEDISIPAWKYADDGTPPNGYTSTDDPIDWDKAHTVLIETEVLKFTECRDKISAAYALLSTPTDAQKKVASKWFVINESVRDTVHSTEEQEVNASHYVLRLYDQNHRTSCRADRDLIKDADVTSIDTTTDTIIV